MLLRVRTSGQCMEGKVNKLFQILPPACASLHPPPAWPGIRPGWRRCRSRPCRSRRSLRVLRLAVNAGEDYVLGGNRGSGGGGGKHVASHVLRRSAALLMGLMAVFFAWDGARFLGSMGPGWEGRCGDLKTVSRLWLPRCGAA